VIVVVRGDARLLPLADATADLAICSPPYWSLRDYHTAHLGEIGAEADWRDWLAALLEVTAELARVLKPTGSIFVNLGDKYQSAAQGPDRSSSTLQGGLHHRPPARALRTGIPDKSLLLLPERYRVACVDTLGLICRAVIIWSKANALPESCRDRVRRTHEEWVHLVKHPRHYAAIDEVREPYRPSSLDRDRYGYSGTHFGARNGPDAVVDGGRNRYEGTASPLGSVPGSVWTIPSEPLRLPDHLSTQHHAAFGVEWPRRLILGWSPPGICLDCRVVFRSPRSWRSRTVAAVCKVALATRWPPRMALMGVPGNATAPTSRSLVTHAAAPPTPTTWALAGGSFAPPTPFRLAAVPARTTRIVTRPAHTSVSAPGVNTTSAIGSRRQPGQPWCSTALAGPVRPPTWPMRLVASASRST